MKRFLSLLLAFTLVLTCALQLPVVANAAEDPENDDGKTSLSTELIFSEDLTEQKNQEDVLEKEQATQLFTETSATNKTAVIEGICGENVAYLLSNDGILTIFGSGTMYDYAAGVDVPWYSLREAIQKIVIEDGVTAIGSRAFYNCTELTEVSIGDDVATIGTYAFRGAIKLTGIQLPCSVINIADFAYWACSNLARIVFDGNAPTIGDNTFGECAPSIEIQFNEGNVGFDKSPWVNFMLSPQHLGRWIVLQEATCLNDGSKELFCSYCQKTITEVIPGGHNYQDGVCTVCNDVVIVATGECGSKVSWKLDGTGKLLLYGSGATYDYSSANNIFRKYRDQIRIIEIQEGITYISRLFEDCSKLTHVSFPESLTEIGSFAFANCYALNEIVLPPNLKVIGTGAFERSGLNMDCLEIPESTTTIRGWVFAYCRIRSIVLPANIRTIESSAFLNCYLKCVFYRNSASQKNSIYISSDGNTTLLKNATWHYEVENTVFAENNCYYCTSCDNYFTSTGDYALAKIVFKNWDGTEISTQNIRYNGEITLPAIPTKLHEQGHIYQYIFDGWTPEVSNICKGNASYLATYREAYVDYTIRFVDRNGLELSQAAYHWGDVVTPPVTRTNDFDDTYACTYTFAGWDKPIVNCTGNATYTATYTSAPLKQLLLISKPNQVRYRTGDSLDLTGLALQCVYANDVSISLNSVNAQCVSADLSAPGRKVVTITIGGQSVEFEIYVHDPEEAVASVDPSLYPQSSHDYSNNLDETKTFTYPGAQSLVITFNSRTSVENNYDYIYVYDGAGNQIAKYTGTTAANKTLTITGDTFKVRLTSDSSNVKYGYAFFSIQAKMNTGNVIHQPVIDPTTVTCTQNGLTEGSHCDICGDILVAQEEVTALGHDYKTVFTWSEVHTSCTVAITCERGCGLSEVLNCTVTHSEPNQAKSKHTAVAEYAGERFTDVLTCDNFLIAFKNWDNTEISSTYYHTGDTVTAPTNPTKAADQTYTYTFAGWDSDVVNCAGDATYTATYMPSYIDYTITFQYEDGTVIKQCTVHYGDSVAAPADPIPPDVLGDDYEFSGWDKEVTACQGNAVYTAVFARKYISGDLTGDDKINSLDGLLLMRYLNGWNVNIASPEAMDVNGDGKVNSLDGLILMRYLNGWDITLG